LTEHYVQRPDTIVIAGIRSPASEQARSLTRLPAGKGSKVLLAKIDATSDTDVLQAMDELKQQHSIDRLDVVIANAGIFTPTAYQKIGAVDLNDLRTHIDVNAYSVVRLFQGVWPLLSKSSKPIFLLNSAGAATLGGMKTFAHFPLNSYAASKVHFEYPDLIAFAVHPGSVVTQNRTEAAKMLGVEVEGSSVEECVIGMTQLVSSHASKPRSR
jgi:norsolorinic acid ketoreductase